MRRIAFVLHGEHIKAPLRKFGESPQVFADYFAEIAALLAVHGGLGGFNVPSSARLDLDKAEHIFVPADEVNFSVMPRAAEVARNHNVPASAKVKIGVFLPATAGTVVSGNVLRHATLWSDAIKKTEDGLSDAAGEHLVRLAAEDVFSL